jgi:hypothetical protein
MALKPWRQVITPHRDILSGNFQDAEFAADLNKVAKGVAGEEYQNAGEFFDRTFITEGMALLLKSVIQRLGGRAGDPVIQLKTAFGGGKTHALLSVYHLVRRDVDTRSLRGIPRLLDQIGITDFPPSRVAVLDGHALSPSEPKHYENLTVKTLWGEMAWQLGGREAFDMLSRSDADGSSPGKEVLAALFDRFSPCVVLIDEAVAYVRQFEAGKSYSGGTFESNMSFFQALCEAAALPKPVVVLATLPESEMELGGMRGKESLEHLEKIFGRIEAVWKPVAAEEGFEIVRRRLFGKVSDDRDRDATCRAFSDIYTESSDLFPSETIKHEYLDRLIAAYPIHPEIFDRMYEDWATLEKFQRTRGVLRLMAKVIHRLWVDDNTDYLIMPASIALYDGAVALELARYLPVGWEPVIEKNVDGEKADPTTLDKEKPHLGSINAARRVARTVFLGSAPSVAAMKVRGLDLKRIHLGCVQPQQHVGPYDDALRDLTDRLHYLYTDKDRYWYDTRPNLRKEAEERAGKFLIEQHLVPEIQTRLRQILKGSLFAAVHVFASDSDIPDNQDLRLVVLTPLAPHRWKQKNSEAQSYSNKILNNRGAQARKYQNRIVYLATDSDYVDNIFRETKRYLAWKSIEEDQDALNLDAHQRKEAKTKCMDADTKLNAIIRENYRWLLVPMQEPKAGGGLGPLAWEEARIETSAGTIMDGIRKALQQSEYLITEWSPVFLNACLETWYWRNDQQEILLSTLWDDFCSYPYLPRLLDSKVLCSTVSDGVQSRDYFGYADGKEGEKYLGLLFGQQGPVHMDKSSLVVHKDAAAVQIERTKDPIPGGDPDKPPKPGTDQPDGGEPEPVKPPPRKVKSFHGRVELNPVMLGVEASNIAGEVVQHFSSIYGTDVRVTLEIDAKSSDGFTESLVRTVSENCKTLKFGLAEFEEG